MYPARVPRHVFSRYLTASVLALGVDYAVLIGLVYLWGAGGTPSAAVAYCTGALVHYGLSRRFVFARGWMHTRWWAELGGFLASGLVGLLITVLILHAGSTLLALPIPLSKTFAVGASFLVTYLLRRRLVFRA